MRGHVTQRASGRWAYVIDAGVHPDTGRRKQLWKSGFGTKRAAEQALTEVLGRADRGEVLDPDRTPLRDYLTRWLDERVDELAPLSVTQYRSVIRNHVSPAPIGGMPIGKIRPAHLRTLELGLREKQLAVSTRSVIFAVISKALGDAALYGLIPTNPSVGVRARATGGRSPAKFTAWTAAELRQLLDVTGDDRLAALWRVAVATGARRGELLGLTWLGYSSEAGTLTISQQVVPTRGGPTIQPVKTKRSNRTIRLDRETIEALEARREAMLAERERAGDAYDDHDLIFADELGRPMNPQRLTERFSAHRKASGIRAGRLHDVRHSVATLLLTAGVPVHVVSARLGHASAVMTLTTYAHVLPTSDEQAAAVMAEELALTSR